MNKPISEQFHIDEHALSSRIFKPYEHQFIRRKSYDEQNRKAAESFGQSGRDWVSLGSIFASFSNNAQWKNKLAVAKLYDSWPQIVGNAIAQNSRIGKLQSGVLIIYAISPAWATQLSYMSENILKKIHEEVPGLDIEEIRIVGPVVEPYKRRRY